MANKVLYEAIDKYNKAMAYDPAADIIKTGAKTYSYWQAFKTQQSKEAKKRMAEYIVDRAPLGLEHWNGDGIDLFTQELRVIAQKQDKAFRKGDDAGVIAAKKEYDQLMKSVNAMPQFWAEHKLNTEGSEKSGLKGYYSKAANTSFNDQIINGTYTVFRDEENGEIMIQTFTEGDKGSLTWNNPMTLTDFDAMVFLERNDIGVNVTKDIQRMVKENYYNPGQLHQYISQVVEDDEILYSAFHDDIFSLTDSKNFTKTTFADQYQKENNLTDKDMEMFLPNSKQWLLPEDQGGMSPADKEAAKTIMRDYVIGRKLDNGTYKGGIMGLNQDVFMASRKPQKSKAETYGIHNTRLTSNQTIYLGDGSNVQVGKDIGNTAMRTLDNPREGNFINGWDGYQYTYKNGVWTRSYIDDDTEKRVQDSNWKDGKSSDAVSRALGLPGIGYETPLGLPKDLKNK